MISALLPNYARAELAFERGEGAWLWTVDGRRFLDFGSGIATGEPSVAPSGIVRYSILKAEAVATHGA